MFFTVSEDFSQYSDLNCNEIPQEYDEEDIEKEEEKGNSVKLKFNNDDNSISNSEKYRPDFLKKQTKSSDIPLQMNEEDDNKKKKMDDMDKNEIKMDQNLQNVNENMIQHQENNNENCMITNNKKLLARTNDLLAQSSTETLLDLLKAHNGIKECSEETVRHINAVN